MTDSAEISSGKKHPKRPFQFGMRTLLTLPIYIGGFFAIGVWLGWPMAVFALTIPTVILCRHYGTTVVEAATLIVVLSMLSALMLPAVQSSNPSRRRGTCMNNLRVIGEAILQYEAEAGCLPPPHTVDESGWPLTSWRTMILPYLEHTDIYSRYRFDEPWDGPDNIELVRLVQSGFLCPMDPYKRLNDTSYLAVVGPGTVWSTEAPVRVVDIDDPSRTILLVEVARSGVCWLQPRDLTLDQALQGINPTAGRGISSGHPGGVNVLFVDGHIEFLSDRTSLEELRDLLTLEKKETAEAGEVDDN